MQSAARHSKESGSETIKDHVSMVEENRDLLGRMMMKQPTTPTTDIPTTRLPGAHGTNK
jgi:hypothetical protein